MRLRSVLLCLALAASTIGAACAARDPASRPSTEAPEEPSDASPIDAGPAVLALVPRCTEGDFDRQRHGATCLCCHAEEFGVAGSVDPDAAPVERLLIVDARGDVASLSPNGFANFFRHFAMTPPLQAIAYGPDGEAAPMRALAPSADCNVCHGPGGTTAQIHGP